MHGVVHILHILAATLAFAVHMLEGQVSAVPFPVPHHLQCLAQHPPQLLPWLPAFAACMYRSVLPCRPEQT